MVFPSEVALSITLYVEGGSTAVIPSPGVDHDVSIPLSLIAQDQDVMPLAKYQGRIVIIHEDAPPDTLSVRILRWLDEVV